MWRFMVGAKLKQKIYRYIIKPAVYFTLLFTCQV